MPSRRQEVFKRGRKDSFRNASKKPSLRQEPVDAFREGLQKLGKSLHLLRDRRAQGQRKAVIVDVTKDKLFRVLLPIFGDVAPMIIDEGGFEINLDVVRGHVTLIGANDAGVF